MIVFFPGSASAELDEVGGKAHSLIGMTNQGLPVPPGAVLTTAFFAPWFDAIKATPAWRAVETAEAERWPALCAELKAAGARLAPTAAQQQGLDQCRSTLAAALGDGALFAVRSSSPEEDLQSASFAGGYETCLGVALRDLEETVRRCFVSTLDERVFVYKATRGFDLRSPRTAVIVQQQIASDVAGVAFSLNPLTNDYDEAVIDANWGLGESVVAGSVSPDHFIVDKVTKQVIERKIGAKQTSTWLGPDGGTLDRPNHRSAEWTLEDDQLRELTDVVCRIEALYGQPTDIEWAYARGRLHVLQARPITAYVPLPEEMLTRPGERRRLYSDGALADGVTINAPISPMGSNWMEDLTTGIVTRYAGNVQIDTTVAGGLAFAAGGRLYTNLSNALWLWRPEALARRSEGLSAVAHEIISNVDVERYRAPTRPSWGGLWTFRLVPRVLWRMRQFIGRSLWAIVAPRRARRAFQRTADAYERAIREIDYSLPLTEFRRRYSDPAAYHVADVTLPPLVAFISAMAWIDALVRKDPPEVKALAEKLKLGFPDNVVVEMGSALFRLAKMIDPADFNDLILLTERIENRHMPADFLEAWDRFVARFGCRGPLEMDVASPRYADTVGLAIRQMSFMTVDDEAFDPEIAQKQRVEERQRAYEDLMRRFGWFRRMLLRRAYTIVDLFAGTRDTPKYHMVLYNYGVRRRALIEGRRLAAEDRLDAAEHVFDLSFKDLEAAASYPSMDLRATRALRTRFLNKLKAQVRTFPPVIDSRGRILRPPARPEKPGELSGMSVSPGVVTGPVKVLHSPHEKPIDKGDVLVAYTTDPGWTPLFVNAAAIVLEVGGMLQHGAVIAREYGKPCVAGIDGVMTKLRDAQRVEVDGTAGVVRLL